MITNDYKAFLQFLADQGESGQVNEMQSSFLKAQGYEGSTDDMWNEYLENLGFTGTLPEKMLQWIISPSDYGDDFVFSVQTTADNETFTIPLNTGVFNATVSWGDGSSSTITSTTDPDLTHTYAKPGTHIIRVASGGQWPNIYFNNSGDAAKVRRVIQLGDVGWTGDNTGAWYGCTGLTQFTSGSCNVANITIYDNYFRDLTGCALFDISTMVTTAGTSYNSTWRGMSLLTGLDISTIDFNGATDIDSFIRDMTNLVVLNISGIDTSTVVAWDSAFRDLPNLGGTDFTQLNTSSGSTFTFTFEGNGAPGVDVSTWDFSSATDLTGFAQGIEFLDYDALLVSLSGQTLNSTVTADFGDSIYTATDPTWTAREDVVNTDSWNITDGGAIPVAVGVPIIDNTSPGVGDTLTATAPTVQTDLTVTDNWQWYVNDVLVSGATSSTYTVLAGDEGEQITVEYTPSVAVLGNGETVESAATNAVTSASFGNDLVFTVETTTASEDFTIPCASGGTFNATIDWGDSSSDSTITAFDDVDLTHTYAVAGTYTIRISGSLPNIRFNNQGTSRSKVRQVLQLGNTGLTRADSMWRGCDGMTSHNATPCDVSGVFNFNGYLRQCSSLVTADYSNMNPAANTNLGNIMNGCTSCTTITGMINLGSNGFTSATEAFTGVPADDFDITGWSLSSGSLNLVNLFGTGAAGLITTRFDELLSAWGAKTIGTTGITVDFGPSTYTAGGAGETGRNTLTGAPNNWIINDGGSVGASVPDAFVLADWSAADSLDSITVTINTLPANNGAAITDIEYRIDSGSWVSSGVTTGFTVSPVTVGSRTIELRSVNSAGNSAASDLKNVTVTEDTGGGGEPAPSVDQYFGSSAVASRKAAIPATGARGYVTPLGGLDDQTIGTPTQTIYISNRPGAKSSGTSTENDPLNESAGLAAYNAAAPSGSNVNIRVLWERGYNYNNSTRLKPNNVGGISQTQPLRLGAFGSGTRPKFTNIQTWGGSQKSFVLMKDLHLTDSLLINGAIGEHLRIQDCEFSEEGSLALQTGSIGTRIRNVTLRNNYHHDISRPDSTSQWDLFSNRIQGLYFFAVSGMTVEDCLFDQISWKEGYNENESAGPMPPSKWSHGVYNTTGNEDITYNGCIFSRCSSFGLQTRSGSDVYNCLFVENNIVSNPSSDYTSTNANDGNWSFFGGNVFLQPSKKNATNIGARGRGIAPDNKLQLFDNVAVGNNDGFDVWLVSNGNTPAFDNTVVHQWGDVSSQNVPGGVSTRYQLPANFFTNLRADWTGTRDTILQEVRDYYNVTI